MSSTQEVINKTRCAEVLDIWGEKAREYERLTRAKEVAEIIRAYCPDGGNVSYDDLYNRYRRLMEKSDALKVQE